MRKLVGRGKEVIKTGSLFTNYCRRQNRLGLGKFNLLLINIDLGNEKTKTNIKPTPFLLLSQVQLNSFHSKLVPSSCFWLVLSAPGWICLYRSATHMANRLSSVQSSFPLYLEVSLALYQALIPLLFFVYIVIFEIFLKMSQSYILNIIFKSTW